MKLSNLIMIQALVWIALGIGFTLYAPLMMAFFSVPDDLASPLAYWQVAAFARLYGVTLLGFGLLLLAVRGALDTVGHSARRGIVFALLLAHLLAVVVTVSQQLAAWLTPAGWILVILQAFFVFGYLFSYIRDKENS